MHIRPAESTKTIDINTLINILKSKDRSLYESNKWLFEGNSRFLEGGKSLGANKVAFASYPRSGNSFMRKYLEMVTGVATGSDNTLHLNVIL